MRILVIEDNDNDVALVRRLLADGPAQSAELVPVRSLKDAVARLANGDIEVVLLDLSLPDSYGLETFIRLQAHAANLPIVVLTGTDEEGQLALEAIRKGAQDYLEKDRVDRWALRRALRYAVERKRIELALQAAKQELQRQVDNTAWLNRIMMEQGEELRQSKEEVQELRARLAEEPPRGTHPLGAPREGPDRGTSSRTERVQSGNDPR